ncbi:MAG: hypothetical protein HQL37_06975 [Alphaproteobacteria bacterium]|nr:hypothetical protein [Alphaproteobacteria bacterium]
MQNSGTYSLGDFTITTAGTQVGTPVTDIGDLHAALFEARLAYGSGGTTAKLYLQTSANQGTTWADIACITFGTAAKAVLLNRSALTPTGQVVPTDGAMADDTAVDGVLGDRLRAKLVTTGTYAGSTVLEVRVTVR